MGRRGEGHGVRDPAHEEPCLQALEATGTALAGVTPDAPVLWPWLYPLSPAKVDGYRGTCAALLRLPTVASSALHAALAGLGEVQVKQRALLLADLAAVRVTEGAVDEAARLTGETFTIGAHTRSEKVLDRVRGLRRQLAPWQSAAAVRALDEQLLAAFLT